MDPLNNINRASYQEIGRKYNNILSKNCPPDTTPVQNTAKAIDLYRLVTKNVILETLETSKLGAAGLDGITLRQMSNITRCELLLLYNTMHHQMESSKVTPSAQQRKLCLHPCTTEGRWFRNLFYEGQDSYYNFLKEHSSFCLNRLTKMIRPPNSTIAMKDLNRASELHQSFNGIVRDAHKNHKMCNPYTL